MEEILASIRRIIAGDEASAPSAGRPAGPPAPARPETPAVAAPSASPAANELPAWNVPVATAASANVAAAAPPTSSAPPAAVANNIEISGLAGMLIPDDGRTPHREVWGLTDTKAMPDTAQALRQRAEPHDGVGLAEASVPSAKPVLTQPTLAAVGSEVAPIGNTVVSNTGRTLEDLVREMLRPILKSWLDDHLPGLVERIVKADIERVLRGRSPLGEG